MRTTSAGCRQARRIRAEWLQRSPATTVQRRARARRSRPATAGRSFSVLMPTCDSDPRWLQRAVDSVRAQTSRGLGAVHRRRRLGPPRSVAGARGLVPATIRGSASCAARCAGTSPQPRTPRSPSRAESGWPCSITTTSSRPTLSSRWPRRCGSSRRRTSPTRTRTSCSGRAPDGRALQAGLQPGPAALPELRQSPWRLPDRAGAAQVGGFREGLEGAQDHDLALRVLESPSPERIVHVPQVLYHWRATPGLGGRWPVAEGLRARCGAPRDRRAPERAPVGGGTGRARPLLRVPRSLRAAVAATGGQHRGPRARC